MEAQVTLFSWLTLEPAAAFEGWCATYTTRELLKQPITSSHIHEGLQTAEQNLLLKELRTNKHTTC